MKLDEIVREWKKDSEVDVADISGEIAKVSRLHSKYMNMYTEEKIRRSLLEIDYDKLRKIKRDYYRGRFSAKTIQELGWDPINHEIGPAEVSDYLKGDSDLCEISGKLSICDIKSDLLKDIVKAIHARGFSLRTLVDWEKFKNGVG